jgi:peptidylprolyl isomerase
MAKAQAGDKVSVHYTGKFDNGKVFDSSVERDPLLFVIGRGMLIEGFDRGVVGMDIGEKKTVNLTPDLAYGERNEELVIDIPINQFPDTMKPESGMMISIQQANGAVIPALITKVEAEKVTIDANHALAGKNLTFDLELIENFGPAAEDDDCGMGCCSDDCGDDCCSGCH